MFNHAYISHPVIKTPPWFQFPLNSIAEKNVSLISRFETWVLFPNAENDSRHVQTASEMNLQSYYKVSVSEKNSGYLFLFDVWLLFKLNN